MTVKTILCVLRLFDRRVTDGRWAKARHKVAARGQFSPTLRRVIAHNSDARLDFEGHGLVEKTFYFIYLAISLARSSGQD